MKKRTLLFLSILATISFTSTAENLRESIAIVRPNFSESTQTFLTDFSKSLRKDGFYAAADILQNYGKGSFGTGFAYRDKRDGRLYIITNRHVVEQAETVDVEFSLPGNSSKTFATCPVVGVHDDFDVAFIALPEEVARYNRQEHNRRHTRIQRRIPRIGRQTLLAAGARNRIECQCPNQISDQRKRTAFGATHGTSRCRQFRRALTYKR